MAGGGNFTPGVAKIRPGTYVNFKSTRQPVTFTDDDGIVVIPFMTSKFGPAQKYVEINADTIERIPELLGYQVNDTTYDNMRLVREALKACPVVKVFIVGTGGTAATKTAGGLTVTAKYPGTRGNDIRFSVVANPTAGFDINVYFGNEGVYTYEGIADVAAAAAIDNPVVTIAAGGEDATLTATAAVALTGGVDVSATNANFTTFLDTLDNTQFDAVCFPVNSTSDSFNALATAFVSKINYLRNSIGKLVRGAMPQFAANHIGIDTVVNAPVVDGVQLTVAEACAYVAALSASSDEVTSNTNKVYPGADGLEGTNLLSHEQIESYIKAGGFVFSLSDDGSVVVEYDINSLTTPASSQDDTYKKNRVIRAIDGLANAIKATFAPNTFSNTDESYDIMDGLGAAILARFQEAGALKNVADGDFAVDRNQSTGDSAYFNVAAQPVDSIEKLYFTIATN
ncbi:MAG: phage tail sheath subtilisin-like domain-containing protein [Eubacterium sp.]|nr:phage tail sheath subtilisin-like domain-containing protein [Eubacterium sp.]MBR1761911.1 phage tail sheath subtilisin-like domain-containing protein [Eubacterium sp.]